MPTNDPTCPQILTFISGQIPCLRIPGPHGPQPSPTIPRSCRQESNHATPPSVIVTERLRFFSSEFARRSDTTGFRRSAHSAGGSRQRLRSTATVWSGVPDSQGTTAATVPATRLDTAVEELSPQPRSIGLWIDVEGSAFEVLEGAAMISDRVTCIHVEVESRALWQGQRLCPDVMALLARRGFRPVARSVGRFQFDVLFVRTGWRALPMAVIAVLATRVLKLGRVCKLVFRKLRGMIARRR